MTVELRPPVKYVGGKRKLAPAILEKFPEKIEGTYYEPFVGGGAIFCALVNAGRLPHMDAVLCDVNQDLIALYEQMRDEPEVLVAELTALDKAYKAGSAKQTEALYYRVRDEWNAGDHAPSKFVFLKQTAFNGLWRVNKDGALNAAWGKYGHRKAHGIDHDQSPCICDEANIMEWHRALQQVGIWATDATSWPMGLPRNGDAVYLDPPYVGTFTGYHEGGFGVHQHTLLLDLARRFQEGGAFVAYSNSLDAEPLLRLVWPGASVERLSTSYTVNRDPNGRSGKEELLAWTK